MTERVIRDGAGDLWVVEGFGEGSGEAGARLRCRHELGYELVVTVTRPLAELDERKLRSALEAERRRPPKSVLSDAA